MMNGNKTTLCLNTASGSFSTAKNYLEMLKLHLCLYISISAIFGHVMASRRFSFEALLLGGCVLILACGAAVLNNIQDREYDSFFCRTQDRSLPQKRVAVSHAAAIALLMIGCGLSGLLVCTGAFSFFWGMLAVLSYNGLYTPLKKRSLLAILPGSISGMLPPLIGWAATGKSLSDPAIVLILIVFGLWQIPHSFIILLKTRQTKTHALKRFPCFTHVFSQNEIKVQILIWTSLYSLAMLLFVMNGSIKNQLLSAFSGVNAVVILLLVSVVLLRSKTWNLAPAFAGINLSMLCFMGIGICDTCFS